MTLVIWWSVPLSFHGLTMETVCCLVLTRLTSWNCSVFRIGLRSWYAGLSSMIMPVGACSSCTGFRLKSASHTRCLWRHSNALITVHLFIFVIVCLFINLPGIVCVLHLIPPAWLSIIRSKPSCQQNAELSLMLPLASGTSYQLAWESLSRLALSREFLKLICTHKTLPFFVWYICCLFLMFSLLIILVFV